jgi:DNA ligase 4
MDFLASDGKDADDEGSESLVVAVEAEGAVSSSSGAVPPGTTTTTGATTLSDVNCSALRFSDICALFERMGKVQGSAAKLKLLFSKDLKRYLDGQSLFPLLRIILPLNDTERGKYGLKQASIAKTYVAALHLDKNTDDAKRLLNWKDPTKSQGVELSKLVTGDFGLILEDVLRSRVRSEPSALTLREVNKLLDDLANALTVEDKMAIMRTRVLDHFNAVEQKWLVRIIFQDLKIGLKHENVLKAFYPNALKRYDECTNLRTVCDEQGKAVNAVGIQLFVNFSPMLAKGFPNASLGQVNTVENAVHNNPFVMDLKLDGERILCHIGDDNSFTLFTRRGNDYTDNYWPVAHNIIMSLRKKGHKFSCILDGEICAFDRMSQNFVPFGQNLGVARLEREYGEDKQVCYFFYYYLFVVMYMFIMCIFCHCLDSRLVRMRLTGTRICPNG